MGKRWTTVTVNTFTITVVATVTYLMVVSKVNRALITVIDLNGTTITINRLLRTAILIFFNSYNAAVLVIVYLS